MKYPFPITQKVDELVLSMPGAECGTVFKFYAWCAKAYGEMSDTQRQLTQECLKCLFEHFDEANQEED